MRVRTFSALRQLVKEGDLAMSKIPSFPFYIGDWMKDPALRSVTRAARGLWMDMICLMWESPRRGFLEHPDGSPHSRAEVSSLVGGEEECRRCGSRPRGNGHKCPHQPAQIEELLRELERAGVYSKTSSGVIYSRRMVRDEAIRTGVRNRVNEFRERHKAETDPDASSKSNANVTQPRNANVTPADAACNADVTRTEVDDVTLLYTPPSSSSTSSTSSSVQEQKLFKNSRRPRSTQAQSATSPGVSENGVVSDEVEKPEERRPEDPKIRDGQIIEALFNFYCDELHRDRTKYTLTPIRKAKALLRLHERTKIRGSLALAVDDINTAIKNLAASEWHITNGHVDWNDQIFRSAEEFEKRLTWVKPNGGKSHASGYETLDQRNERLFQAALKRMDIDSPEDDGEPETEPDTRRS
jgi:hypothetical protein